MPSKHTTGNALVFLSGGGILEDNKESLRTIRHLSPKIHSRETHWIDENPSTYILDSFLHALSPVNVPARPLSEDLRSISRLVSIITEAVDENILTKEEAEVLVGALASKFVERRVGRIMSRLFSVEKPRLFLAAAGHSHERSSK